MAVIHVLDKHTAELIAAGEVVERPASVAKELLENAIDAGATQITLTIESGGVRRLEVSDNGSGIEAEYIETAFVRHATSKIVTEEDLGHIHTLGFRGEALASIASVAKVEVLTRTGADEYACRYRIAGGETLGMEPDARPVGTTITVNELFYNTPARMKFLKKDASEGTFVADAVIHAAISHPEISFKFIREGRQQFVTPGDGRLKSALYAVVGRDFAKDLLPVEGQNGVYGVTGLVTPPRACRASRGAQYFYVNGRYVKNRTMMAAMENAYKGTLMQGKFPGGVLMLTLPPELVDVNVHPAKTEIRFAREGDVFDTVYRAVRTALQTPGSGECRFTMDAAPKARQTPPPQPEKHFTTLTAAEYRALDTLTAPVAAKSLPAPQTPAQAQLHGERDAYNAPEAERLPETRPMTAGLQTEGEALLDLLPETQPVPRPLAEQEGPEEETPATALSALPPERAQAEQTAFEPAPAHGPLRVVGEVFKTYIITERDAELCLIDKHAAHERILFEKLNAAYGDVPAQLLLAPVLVNLSAEEKQAVMQNLALLQKAGVEAEDYGGSTVAVRTVPADVSVDDVEDMLVELAAHLASGSRSALREKTEWVLHSIACRAAIKAGDRTDRSEMLALAEKIMDGSIPPFCPHGRPCVLKLTQKELEKQFGRLV